MFFIKKRTKKKQTDDKEPELYPFQNNTMMHSPPVLVKLKPMSKQTTKSQKGFEESLWETANKLRGTVESSEYKHIVLSLIFLKFASDKFEARKQALIQDGQAQ